MTYLTYIKEFLICLYFTLTYKKVIYNLNLISTLLSLLNKYQIHYTMSTLYFILM